MNALWRFSFTFMQYVLCFGLRSCSSRGDRPEDTGEFTLPKIAIGILLTFTLCFSANAALIGGKNWLQVTDTTGYSWSDLDAIFDTNTGQCDVVGCLLGGSINLTGAVWASSDEVDSMTAAVTGSAVLLPRNLDGDISRGYAASTNDPLFALFDPTVDSLTSQKILGRTRSFFEAPGSDEFRVERQIGTSNSGVDIRTLEAHTGRNDRRADVGIWLYRTAVPVPTTLALFGLGLAGLGFTRRTKV